MSSINVIVTPPAPIAITGNLQTGIIISLEGGVDSFIFLNDVPSSYSGQAGKFVAVKANTSGLEFQTALTPAVYDPTGIKADVFNADNHINGTVNKVYTATEKNKLTGIETGAQANVNADWNAVSGTAQILNKPAIDVPVIGDSLRLLSKYTAISPSSPWFCMSLPDQNWTTTNYPTAFIDEMRSRKVAYDELNTNVVSFTGSWAGGVFTLDNNVTNTTMLAELAEEYLFAGSPTTNWRLLNDGTYDFNVTAITVAARTIQVSTADHSPSGTSISIYLHRVYNSTTSARHFSWAGLGLYMAGSNKVSGLRRRDAFQRFQIGMKAISGSDIYYSVNSADEVAWAASGSSGVCYQRGNKAAQGSASGAYPYPDGTNGTPRTDTKTRIESGTLLLYLYVGSYTA